MYQVRWGLCPLIIHGSQSPVLPLSMGRLVLFPLPFLLSWQMGSNHGITGFPPLDISLMIFSLSLFSPSGSQPAISYFPFFHRVVCEVFPLPTSVGRRAVCVCVDESKARNFFLWTCWPEKKGKRNRGDEKEKGVKKARENKRQENLLVGFCPSKCPWKC